MRKATSSSAAAVAQGELFSLAEIKIKRCTKCEAFKPEDEFPWRKDKAKPHRHSWCTACVKGYMRGRYVLQREERKDYSRRHYAEIRSDPQRFLRYSLGVAAQQLGLDRELVERHFDGHGGGCDICGGQNVKDRTRLSIDHDHETGRFRGLLCSTCNTAIGLLRDDPKVARAAAGYLQSRGL
jgi:hypothetical protein